MTYLTLKVELNCFTFQTNKFLCFFSPYFDKENYFYKRFANYHNTVTNKNILSSNALYEKGWLTNLYFNSNLFAERFCDVGLALNNDHFVAIDDPEKSWYYFD